MQLITAKMIEQDELQVVANLNGDAISLNVYAVGVDDVYRCGIVFRETGEGDLILPIKEFDLPNPKQDSVNLRLKVVTIEDDSFCVVAEGLNDKDLMIVHWYEKNNQSKVVIRFYIEGEFRQVEILGTPEKEEN